jgi:hypothetical protein
MLTYYLLVSELRLAYCTDPNYNNMSRHGPSVVLLITKMSRHNQLIRATVNY